MFVRDFVELNQPVADVLRRLDEEAVEVAACEAGALARSLLGRAADADEPRSHVVLGSTELRLGVSSRPFEWRCDGIQELFTHIEGDLAVIPVADRRSELLLTATCRPSRRLGPTSLRSNAITDIAVRRFLNVLATDVVAMAGAGSSAGSSGPTRPGLGNRGRRRRPNRGPFPLLSDDPSAHDSGAG